MEENNNVKKQKIKILLIEIFCVLGIVAVIGYTYSYFLVEASNSTAITGTAATLNIDVDVDKILPSNNKKLIPQLDDYITSAIIGRNGGCVDDNFNTVCQVYEITVTNNNDIAMYLDGTVEIDNGNMPNLKWAEVSGTTTPSLLSSVNNPATTSFKTNVLLSGNGTLTYYIVIWISETGGVQTDSGDFTGVVTFGTHEEKPVPNIMFANFTVDNVASTTVPTGSYTVTPTCTDASATYDYETGRFKVSGVSVLEEASCTLAYTTKAKEYLNNKVISLAGTTQGTGQVVNENGYRYEGLNPNNYIKFNNELWRIIGVFDSSSHGQSGYLTKIIRNDSLDGYAWDKNNVNIWPQSSLYNLLNTYYYNATDGTSSGYCYKYDTTVTGNCDYTTGGINDYYRPMVKNVTWYLGGYSSNSATADSFYIYERSTDDTYYYTDNTSYKTTTGYIGLMYASDYGYSVLASSCARTTNLGSYNTSGCAGSSWLHKDGYQWTITPSTSYASRVFYINYLGSLDNNSASSGYASRPVLYLDSSVYILNGDGSKANPYIISMDS